MKFFILLEGHDVGNDVTQNNPKTKSYPNMPKTSKFPNFEKNFSCG